jgi:hypothetical protein
MNEDTMKSVVHDDSRAADGNDDGKEAEATRTRSNGRLTIDVE